jgi:hypothetical protein
MIHVKTMLGLGDAFAARPTIAALMRKDALAIETPWPEIFTDLIANRYCGPSESVFVKPKNLNIRCAKRNVEESKIAWVDAPAGAKRIQLSYSLFKGCKSIPEQIAESAGVTPEWNDFFMPNQHDGEMNYDAGHRWPVSPLGCFRIPTIRTEYKNAARNPFPGLVAAAVDEIGGDWIALNDLDESEREKIEDGESCPSIPFADAELGQLSIPTCLDLVSRARVVVTPVSWMLWAAIAYGTPTMAIWGGYCDPRYILGPIGDLLTNIKAAVPKNGHCNCFNPSHSCDKDMSVEYVREAARSFK